MARLECLPGGAVSIVMSLLTGNDSGHDGLLDRGRQLAVWSLCCMSMSASDERRACHDSFVNWQRKLAREYWATMAGADITPMLLESQRYAVDDLSRRAYFNLQLDNVRGVFNEHVEQLLRYRPQSSRLFVRRFHDRVLCDTEHPRDILKRLIEVPMYENPSRAYHSHQERRLWHIGGAAELWYWAMGLDEVASMSYKEAYMSKVAARVRIVFEDYGEDRATAFAVRLYEKLSIVWGPFTMPTRHNMTPDVVLRWQWYVEVMFAIKSKACSERSAQQTHAEAEGE